MELKSLKKYAQSKKGKIAAKKYKQSEKGRLANNKGSKKYRQTEKGKIDKRKRVTKRKRELGWILLCENPFADSVLVDYHHILGAYVVAVPRELHRLYCGKNHLENLRPILEQIYLGD